MENPSKKLLNTVQAAEYLTLSKSKLQCWRVTGGGPRYVKFRGGSVRYRSEDLDHFIESCLTESTSQHAAESRNGGGR